MFADSKKRTLFAALCMIFGALLVFLLPGGVARAEEFSSAPDETATPGSEFAQLDTASLTTAEESEGIFVSGVNVMNGGYWATKDGVMSQEGASETNYNVAYDTATNTLTLKDATIKKAKQTVSHDFYAGILSATDLKDDLNIDIVGENTIEGGSDGSLLFGIVTLNDLNLVGNGNLTIKPETATGTAYGNANMGIYTKGGLTLQGPAVTINNGDSLTSNAGVYTEGNIDVQSGTLKAAAGSVTGEQTDNGPNSVGVYCLKEVNMNGGKLVSIAGQSKGNSFGICSEGDMTVHGGTISAASGEAGRSSKGIWATEELKMTDGTISTVSDAAADYSYGLEIGHQEGENPPVGGTEISGGQITAISSNIPSDASSIDTQWCGSAGIFAFGPFTLTGGDVNAEVFGEAFFGRGFHLCPLTEGSDLNMTGGTLTASTEGSYEAGVGINFENGKGNAANLNLSGGTITATGAPGNLGSYGVNNENNSGKMTVAGGSLTAVSDQASNESIGVNFENITITDGSVIAKSAAATKSLALLKEPDVSGYDAYHWRVAEADAFANKPLVYKETTYFEIQPGAVAEAAVVANPPTGIRTQSPAPLIAVGIALAALALCGGYVLYKKSRA
jgi:hypothetical protein